MDLILFQFTAKPEPSKSLKANMESELIQIAVVCALLASMGVSMVIEVHPARIPESSDRFLMSSFTMAATVCGACGTIHAMVIMLMLNQFQSLDELVSWIDRVGTMVTHLPAYYLVSTILFLIAAALSWMWISLEQWQFYACAGTVFLMWFGGHVLCTFGLQSFYHARKDVRDGYRCHMDPVWRSTIPDR